MYPNPQAALPLPSRPNLEQYKKQAKDLVKACRSGDPDLLDDYAAKWIDHPGTVREFQAFARKKLSEKCSLANAQFVIARAHGFTSWPKLARHIEGVTRVSSEVSIFETAVDAVALIAAGAKLVDRHPPVGGRIDEILARHGSRSDPALSWFGEEPISGRPSRGGRAGS